MWHKIIWSAPHWLWPVGAIVAAAIVLLVWGYLRAPATVRVRSVAAVLKAVGIVALALCLIEPLFSGSRPRPGANLFLILADNSQSLQLRDAPDESPRGETMRDELTRKSEWQSRLGQDFDLRRYVFDSRLRAAADFKDMKFDGGDSALATSLATIADRYRSRPVAGVLLFTDGNATDLAGDDREQIDLAGLPPIFPVIVGSEDAPRDLSLSRVAVSQTNFETAPVTFRAEVAANGYEDETIVVRLLDDAGKEIERQTLAVGDESQPLAVRFQLRPEQLGISFYRVEVAAEDGVEVQPVEPNDDDRRVVNPHDTDEATLANNSRLVMVDRGGGPYRVLYVAGRPNWEFKFLRRAVENDPEIDLVGLVRIAKREPKFDFRSRSGEGTNPLFRGFGNEDDESAERYDQPVLLRLGTRDKEELRGGFPKTADLLYQYHAIVLDDLESEFFTQDQMSLVEQFVSRRGGGLLMVGGTESFAGGGFARTPLGALLPVYLDRLPKSGEPGNYRLSLTREGWLQPWVRLRTTEADENRRLGAMPTFQTLNRIRGIKPGASVLARVTDDSAGAAAKPALVAQRYGKGRSAALLVGDLWRWSLRRQPGDERDLEKAWRQSVRWLVADVPGRIEIDVQRKTGEPSGPVAITVDARDAKFEPLDNAAVQLTVTAPDGSALELAAEPAEQQAGRYLATYVPRQAGAFRASVEVTAADGSEVGSRPTGWVAQPATDEFRRLVPDRGLLECIARETGGELVSADELDRFAEGLPNRKVPITEPWIYPLWHQPYVFLFAVFCLCAEWGLRRWKGLP